MATNVERAILALLALLGIGGEYAVFVVLVIGAVVQWALQRRVSAASIEAVRRAGEIPQHALPSDNDLHAALRRANLPVKALVEALAAAQRPDQPATNVANSIDSGAVAESMTDDASR